MENWKQKPLSQVVSRWIRGTTLNRSRADYYTKTPGPESLPWARVGDMKEGLLCETENYLTKEGVDQIPWLIVPEGAVLLSVSGTIGKSAIAGCDLVVNQAIQAMIFDEGQILPEYACFYLEFYRPWLIERANAVTVPNLTKEQLSGIPVVFPCLEEQQVIVDQLKRARRLMQRSRRSEDTLNRILENAFGKIARSRFKRRKNKPGRGISFSCAPAYMGFFKNTGTACRTRNRYVCTGPFTNRAGLFYKNSRKNKRNKKTVT